MNEPSDLLTNDSLDFKPQEATSTSPTKDAYLINDNLEEKVYHEEKMYNNVQREQNLTLASLVCFHWLLKVLDVSLHLGNPHLLRRIANRANFVAWPDRRVCCQSTRTVCSPWSFSRTTSSAVASREMTKILTLYLMH